MKYVTLPVNTQTKSHEIIKTLLRKYRQKHRDPNLFHLTLERWIRKDGLKFKSVMLLGDEACPLQLQQCCSNPPHDDIKFTLQMRSGALVKIYCSDVVPDAKYKCLSLSTQTTVEETIELMLHCLNLTSQSTPKLQNSNTTTTTTTNDNTSSTTLYTHHNRHFSGSPNPSSSSSSSSYDTSSSSGIESEPNNIDTRKSSKKSQGAGALNSDSRASSVTSISSSSNVSSLSSSLIDQYCLIIERKKSNFTQTLRSDEYLVDVYQGLLAEASRTSDKLHASEADSATTDSGASSLSHHQTNNKSSSSQPLADSVRQSSDQWFFIKLKRRYETENNANSRPQAGAINHVNPRQNMPLPPIPPSQSSVNQQPQQQQQLINSNHLRHFVSTTQIEVNRPGSSLAANNSSCSSYSASTAESELMRDIMRSTPITLPSSYSPHLAAATAIGGGGGGDEVDSGHQAPPPSIILLTPPVRPRRRNLSNVSSTFVPHSSAFVPPPSTATNSISNKRRYDQAQLIEDLDRLNIIAASSAMAPVAESG